MNHLLQDSGLPDEALQAIQTLVSGAGYDTDDPGDLTLGMNAAMATLRVCEGVTTHRAPRGARLGRNAPCPCGSGKKHKKCCLKTGGTGQEPRGYDPGNPLERADLVPRIYDAEALAGDVDGLETLFLEDDNLSKVRFTADKLVRFVMAEPVEEALPPGGEPAREDLGGEERVARYLREVEGIEALGNLERALLRAARDSANCDQDVRSLAAGLALAEMEQVTDGEDVSDAPNPLLSMLFWLTLREAVAQFSIIDGDVRALFPDGAFDASHLAERPDLGIELSRRWEARGGSFLNSLRPAGETAYRALVEHIADGEFPVGLPLLSALPALVRVSALGLRDPRPEEFIEALRTGAADLGTEDAELFDQALELWVEHNRPAASTEALTAIAQVRMETAAGSLGSFGQALVVGAVRHQNCFSLRGEPELPDAPGTQLAELFSPAYLEACGDFLLDNGLSEMAARTWQLCEILGPLPEGVAGKLTALQQDLAAAEIPV